MGGHALAFGSPGPAAVAWAAGFLDGEGCFLTAGDRGCSVTAEGANPLPLYRCRALFGGTVAFVERRRKDQHRQVFRWTLHGDEARAACVAMLPHCTSKAPELEAVALSFAHPAASPFGAWLRARALHHRHFRRTK